MDCEALLVSNVLMGILGIGAVVARDQYRKYKERAIVCGAIAEALERLPASYEDGGCWLSGRIEHNLAKGGWEPFDK